MACFDKRNFSFSPVKTVKIIGSELIVDHTEYVIKVIVGPYEWKVCRRYSEFLRLNDTLPTELKEVAKQLLPKKHFFGNNSEMVVKDRQKKLEIYLQCLFRSLPKISYALMQFLKFDVYEIHGITEFLTEELYNEGDEILSKSKAFSLSALQLHAICKRMELPEPTSAGDPTRDIGHLLDFINRLGSLKVVGNRENFGMSNICPNDLWIHFQHFKSLQSVQFDNCNFHQISIDTHLRKNLKKIKVSNSLTCISEVLLAGMQWEDPRNFPPSVIKDYSWESLERADFASNRIHSLNAPAGILPELKSLDLSHNCLERVEIQQEELQALQSLDISHNKLSDSSFSDVFLMFLTDLDISHNKLKSLTALEGLKNLLKLNSSYNELESVEDIVSLGNFRLLVEVKLVGNPISLKPDYRLVVLELFGDRFQKMTLDSEKVSDKEKDAILVRQAIQMANENFLRQSESGASPNTGKNFPFRKNFRKKATDEIQHSYESRPRLNPIGMSGMTLSASFPNFQYANAEVAAVEVTSDDKEFHGNLLTQDTMESNDNPVIAVSSSPSRMDTGSFDCFKDEVIMACKDGGPMVEGEVGGLNEIRGDFEKSEEQESGHNSSMVNHHHLINHVSPPYLLGLQKIESNVRSMSLKHSRRRKYFLLPETLPNHNNRSLMSLLEDIMDPPDSFGLPETEYRQNNVGHVMWCSALTNLRKSSHTQERPVCVCVTPFKIHLFKVDQLRGDSGIPKIRYFSFILLSDVHCFVVGSGHLYLRVVDRFHPSHVIVLLTSNRIKTENFLEHVKKASRRNIPFLDDYEDPVIINASLQCELQISGFLRAFESSQEIENPKSLACSVQIRFYQLAQFISTEENFCQYRTSAIIFTNRFFYILFQDFVNFPRSANSILEFIPSKPSQHRVAAIFPLDCTLYRIRQYDGETIDKLETNSEIPDFIGYGLELYFSMERQQQFQVVGLRWPTSCMRQEFMAHLHRAFVSKNSDSRHSLNGEPEKLPTKNGKNPRRSSAAEMQKGSYRRAYILDEKLFRSNVSC